MGNQMQDLIKRVANSSNDFELDASDLKRRYFLLNIESFNYIASLISGNMGSFGTGYPFYALPKGLVGNMPIIDEQIRYNNELLAEAEKSSKTSWICKDCLIENYDDMPDLKQVCKPCPNMDSGLKPRKIINRLPDIDMWLVCADGSMEKTETELTNLLEQYNIHTSDVNPVQTIQDMEEITQDIKKGVMPKKFLPIDAHIMEYSNMKKLINEVPLVLAQSNMSGKVPYLPIRPKSYRKTWQYDDEAYNFIYDFLASFTDFNFPDELADLLRTVRNKVANAYTPDELYSFLIQGATESTKRRNQTPQLKKVFYDRIASWNIQNEKGEEDPWQR